MNNKALQRLRHGFTACKGLVCTTIKERKFAYAVAKNARLVDIVLADLQKATEADDGYQAFDKARIALVEEHAVKDEHGKTKMVPGTGNITLSDPAAFTAALTALQESDEHKAAVDRHELMENEEADYKPHMTPLSGAPNGMTFDQVDAIYEIVLDDEIVQDDGA